MLAEFKAAPTAAAKATVATTLARRYNNVERFDSAGYYLEQVAQAKPSAQNWQQAADEAIARRAESGRDFWRIPLRQRAVAGAAWPRERPQ